MRRLCVLVMLSAPVWFLLAVQAQQPAPPNPAIAPGAAPAPVTQFAPLPASNAANTIRRNVSLVILDGVALDPKGNVVTDLKRDDFHLTEDGGPQEIRNFEVPGHFTPSPDITIDSTADLDRLAPRAPVNIVLLDEFNTRFEDMAFARYSLKKLLEKQPDKLDTPTMLIAVNLQNFTVLRDYTQNKAEILTALDKHFVAYPWQVHQGAWVAERYSTAFAALRRVAEASSGHFGHKNMIWLGRGFPSINLSNVSLDAQTQVHNAVQLTVDELRDARVTLYTIDPAGVMVNPGAYGNYAATFAPFGGDPNFQDLARSTGGRNLYGRNDVDAEIGTSIRDGASLYTLTYVSTNANGDPDQFRKISVTIDRPGVTFVTRRGYYPSLRPAHAAPDGTAGRRLVSELAGAATSNMAYDAVHFTVTASSTDPNQFQIAIPSRSLVWYFSDGSKPRFTRIIMVASMYDKKNKPIKNDAHILTFQAPASASPTGRIEVPITYKTTLPIAPKTVRVRFVIRVEGSGHMGTADLTLAPGATASSFSDEASAKPAVTSPTANPTLTTEKQ